MNIFKQLRKQKKLTQVELAKILNVKQNTISQWELDQSIPDYTTLKNLSAFYNVSIDYLLGNETKIINEEDYIKNPNDIISFEEMKKTFKEKGLTDNDIKKLSKEQLNAIADVIKNFKP